MSKEPCDGCRHLHFVTADPLGSSMDGWGCLLTGGHAVVRCNQFTLNSSDAAPRDTALLAAINEADRAMMQVVLILRQAGDERWRPLSRLQSEFVADIQAEETEKLEAASSTAEENT